MGKKAVFLSVILLLMTATVVEAGVRSRMAWRPQATFSATPSTIKAGEKATLSWEATNATSAQLDITVWEPRTNGEIVPLVGSRVVSPTETKTYTFTAFKRRRDLNGDGRADGPRRSRTVAVTVTVVK